MSDAPEAETGSNEAMHNLSLHYTFYLDLPLQHVSLSVLPLIGHASFTLRLIIVTAPSYCAHMH